MSTHAHSPFLAVFMVANIPQITHLKAPPPSHWIEVTLADIQASYIVECQVVIPKITTYSNLST